jgi:ADP-ribosyl-[dinitrogen reductase] hydrolase
MTTARTSTTHPIRVDWLKQLPDLSPGNGKIGLTFAPGKKGPALMGFTWDRDLRQDLDRLVNQYQMSVLICLMEQHELEQFHMHELFRAAQAQSVIAIHGPIPDVQCPTCQRADDLSHLAISAARAGKNVIIHCRGGRGRAGTIGACCYVAAGIAPAHALAYVRDSRPGTVETTEQEQFIDTFHQWRNNHPR